MIFERYISPSLPWTPPNLGPKSQETDLIYITVFGVKVIPRPFLLHPIKPVSHQWVTGCRCCRHHFLFFFSCVHTDLSALAGLPIGGGDIIEHQRKSLADRTGHESPWRRWTSLRMRHRVQEEERVVILTTNLMTHSLLVRMIWARAWTCFCFVFLSTVSFVSVAHVSKSDELFQPVKTGFPNVRERRQSDSVHGPTSNDGDVHSFVHEPGILYQLHSIRALESGRSKVSDGLTCESDRSANVWVVCGSDWRYTITPTHTRRQTRHLFTSTQLKWSYRSVRVQKSEKRGRSWEFS